MGHKEKPRTDYFNWFFKSKQGKDGQLIIRRNLMDEGKILVVAFALKLNEEPHQTSARQIWRKQA